MGGVFGSGAEQPVHMASWSIMSVSTDVGWIGLHRILCAQAHSPPVRPDPNAVLGVAT